MVGLPSSGKSLYKCPHTYLEVCLLGDSKSSQADNKEELLQLVTLKMFCVPVCCISDNIYFCVFYPASGWMIYCWALGVHCVASV